MPAVATSPSGRHVRPRRRVFAAVALAVVGGLTLAACAPAPPEPDAAVMRVSPPPWDAPRDAVSYIRAAGLEELSAGYSPESQFVATLEIVVDGEQVEIPAFVGIDRLRSVEAPLHTHDAGGTVWAEHPTELPTLTVGDLFDLWGVRFDDGCVGDACRALRVEVNGTPIDGDQDPRDVRWQANDRVRIEVQR